MYAAPPASVLSAVTGPLLNAGTLSALLVTGARALDVAAPHRAFQSDRRASTALGPASSLRAIMELVAEPVARTLGYTVVAPDRQCRTGDSWTLAYLRRAQDSSLDAMPLLVAAWGSRLDRLWRPAVSAARSRRSRWAWMVNGTHLRIVDAAAAHGPRWTQVDLDTAADDPATFALLWLIAGAAESPPGDASGCSPLQAPALARLVVESDAYAAEVCGSLRDGVLSASEFVLGAVVGRRRQGDPAAALEQALTVVYRVLFLLFAESRGLVPTWHPVYRTSYSIDALRAAAERGRPDGMWEALRAIGRLASSGCRTGQLSVTPFNGRLFDTRRAPFIERRDLDDELASRAVLALTTRVAPGRGGRERIAYGDLGVEQLGAVYETLLDYQPRVDRDQVRLAPGAGARKASGSYYTPQPLARYIVRQTLTPLVAGHTPDEILSLRVLDPAMGSGAFLVAACQFLAEAYEEALIATGGASASDIGEDDRARMRRLVAERCLFGVDLNPMAVQLARLSLWLATLAGDRPLSFLDHHLRTGDSLVGAWLSALQQAPAPGRRVRRETSPLFGDEQVAAMAQTLVPARFALAGPGDTVEQVRGKEAVLARLERSGSLLSRWKQVADLWCAAWFQDDAPPRSAHGALTDAILNGDGALPAHVADRLLTRASEVAGARRFFHWELEFPEVFFTIGGARQASAGFDAIIGNPPWDMVRADAGEGDARAGRRADAARLVRFAREAGVYAAVPTGQLNRYQLFVERAIALLRHGGRFGLVLPAGLLHDHGSSPIRRLLFSQCSVDGVVSFDNRRAIFPIHRSVRFVALTAARGAPSAAFGARFGDSDLAVLEEHDSGAREWFTVRLGVDLLKRISGDDLAVPDVRQALDLALIERMTSRFPGLGDPAGWNVRFGRELNATDDRPLLVPRGVGWPVIEGKLVQPFAVDTRAATRSVRPADARRRLGDSCGRARLAYRDVSSPGNRQTLIAALLPAGAVSTHTLFCLKTPLALTAQYFLCGLFNSYVVDYLVRQRVSTHVTTAIVERLPVPTRSMAGSAFATIAWLARRLSRQPASGQRADWLAALNATVAALYGLTHGEYARVLATFPLVPCDTRDRALAAFDDRYVGVGSGG